MLNTALITTTGCTQDTHIQYLHDETLILPIHEHLQLHAERYKHKTQHPSHPLHKHKTYFNTPRLKNTIFNNGPYTTTILTDPHTVTTTDIKTNMRHIHTSIVSRHLATRGSNKILRTHTPHIINSEEILPRLTRRILAQLRTNKSPLLKSYIRKVDAKSHQSPLFLLCNTHILNTYHLFNWTHIHTTLSSRDLWTDPAGVTALLARWTEKLAGGPKAGRSDTPHSQGSWEWVDINNNIRSAIINYSIKFRFSIIHTIIIYFDSKLMIKSGNPVYLFFPHYLMFFHW